MGRLIYFDSYAVMGFIVELLAQSKYHRQFELGDYLRTEILPPYWCGQVKIWNGRDLKPTAMLTWARISEKVEQEIHTTGRALTREEWNCGNRLFFNDWISPYDNTREIVLDLKYNIFPGEIATSIRRNLDGTVKKINRWSSIWHASAPSHDEINS